MDSTRNLKHTWEMSTLDLYRVVNNRPNVSYTSPLVQLEEFVSHIVVTRRGWDSLVLRSELKRQDGGPLSNLMSFSKSCIDIVFIYETIGREEAWMESSRHSFTEKTAIWEFDNIIPVYCFQGIAARNYEYMELYITQEITLNPAADNNTQNVTSKKLNVDFATLLEKADFSDIVLGSATGKEFPAHKAILSARSPVFAAMLQSDMKETHENRVEMENVSDELMEAMLKFLYAGTLDAPEMRPGFYEELLAVADQYDVADFRSAILEVIQINMDNFEKLLVLANRHRIMNLRARVIDFIMLNGNELKNREGSLF